MSKSGTMGTRDLSLAAFLSFGGSKPLRAEHDDTGNAVLIFKMDRKTQRAVASYRRGVREVEEVIDELEAMLADTPPGNPTAKPVQRA